MNLPPFLVRMRQFSPLVLVFISAAVAVCAYLQALNYPFIGDDTLYIVNNHKLAEQHLNQLWRFFVEPYNNFTEFLPLRDISYWFDITLFGLSPAAFRIHNILLYLFCLPLIYGVTAGVWRYFRPADAPSAPWVAAAVTALFAVHPSHVEAVVWIAGRKDVLAAMFSLLALWLAIRTGQGQEFSRTHATAALIAMIVAILSKATAAAVAPVIALLWLIFWRDTPKHDRRPLLLLWPLASVLLAMCFAMIFNVFMKFRVPLYFGIEAATRSLAALGWLSRLAVSPEERHYFYPVFEDPYLPFMVAVGVAVLAAAITGGVMILRKRSLAGFALAVFLLLCMPSMQLIPYAPPSLISDRFLAIAVWPAILLIVAMSWRLKPLLRTALLLVIAITWTAQTAKHPLDWRSPEVLIDNELRAYPGYAMPAAYKIFSVQLPQRFYGDAIETAGSIANPQTKDAMVKLIKAHQAVYVESASTGSPQNAMVLLWELFHALKQRPAQSTWDPSMYNLWEMVRVLFENQWKYLGQHFPDDALVHYNAGLWMVNVHKYEDAIVHLRAATESQRLPESLRGAAFENLALALLGTGQFAEAESSLLAALKQPQSNMRIQCLFAMVYKGTGRLEAAARAETKCLSAPDNERVR
jgi:hypothetical protein